MRIYLAWCSVPKVNNVAIEEMSPMGISHVYLIIIIQQAMFVNMIVTLWATDFISFLSHIGYSFLFYFVLLAKCKRLAFWPLYLIFLLWNYLFIFFPHSFFLLSFIFLPILATGIDWPDVILALVHPKITKMFLLAPACIWWRLMYFLWKYIQP